MFDGKIKKKKNSNRYADNHVRHHRLGSGVLYGIMEMRKPSISSNVFVCSGTVYLRRRIAHTLIDVCNALEMGI